MAEAYVSYVRSKRSGIQPSSWMDGSGSILWKDCSTLTPPRPTKPASTDAPVRLSRGVWNSPLPYRYAGNPIPSFNLEEEPPLAPAPQETRGFELNSEKEDQLIQQLNSPSLSSDKKQTLEDELNQLNPYSPYFCNLHSTYTKPCALGYSARSYDGSYSMYAPSCNGCTMMNSN